MVERRRGRIYAGQITADVDINVGPLAAAVRPRAERKIKRVQDRIVAAAKRRAPRRTGWLRRSIRPDEIRWRGPFDATAGVTAHATYAGFVHEGTRPHLILPRKARVLRFNVGGRTVFAARVNHPGTRARPFLREAAVEVAASERLRD